MFQRIRVRQPYDPSGSLIWSAILGASNSAGLFALYQKYDDVPTYLFNHAGVFGVLGSFLFVPAIMALWLAGYYQRKWRIFRMGCVCGGAMAFAFFVSIAFEQPGFLAQLSLWQLAIPVVFALPAAGCVGLLYQGISWGFRTFAFEVVEQDGTLCRNCGYQIGKTPQVERCPECGNFVEELVEPKGTLQLARLLMKRRAKLIGLTLVLFLLAIGIRQFWTVTLPLRRLARWFPSGNVMHYGSMLAQGPGAPNAGVASQAVEFWRVIEGDPTKALVVVYEPNPKEHEPTMQVQLMAMVTFAGAPYPTWGNAFVYSDLSREQANCLLERGVPEGLVKALQDAANTSGWAPLPGGGGVIAGTSIVDAAPYFPAEQYD